MKQVLAAAAARVKMILKKFLRWLTKHTPKVELLAKFAGATVAIVLAVSTLYSMIIGPAEADTVDKTSSEYMYWRIERIADRMTSLEKMIDGIKIDRLTHLQYSMIPPVEKPSPSIAPSEDVTESFEIDLPAAAAPLKRPGVYFSMQPPPDTTTKKETLGWVYIGNEGSGINLENSKISYVVIPEPGNVVRPIEPLPVRNQPIGLINNTEVLTFVDKADSLMVEEVVTIGLRSHVWVKVASN